MKRLLLFFIFQYLMFSNLVAQQTVGLFLNDSLSYNGYTLIAPEFTDTYLIDNCGYVVNSWTAEQHPGSSVYLLENGNLLRTGTISGTFNTGGVGGRIELFSWEGELLWRYDYASPAAHQHHDVAALPNGNILLIAWQYRSVQNAINNGRDPGLTSSLGVWSEQIIELEPVGNDNANIVWAWNLWDHLIQDFDSTKFNYGVIAEHPELVDINFEANPGGGASSGPDWIHLNAIDYNAELDQIVVSSRHLHEFWVLDHSTTTQEAAGHSGGNSGKGGDILYRWGNPQSYDRGSTVDQKLFGQHDVHWIPSGLSDEGKIMIFNNGQNRPGGNFSSVDIIVPPMDNNGNYVLENGSAYGPVDLFWSYTSEPPEDFYSSNISGAQRLPNGNTLICLGRRGLVFEISPDNTIVWEYQSPVRVGSGPINQGLDIFNIPTTLFRAYRYGEDYPAFEGKELIPGDPIELNPLAYDCTIYGNTTTVTESPLLNNVSILGNPIFSALKIKNDSKKTVLIEVFDISGKLITSLFSPDLFIEINTVFWVPGFYVVRIADPASNKFYHAKFVKL
jgi:arylsulfotransferase ASST